MGGIPNFHGGFATSEVPAWNRVRVVCISQFILCAWGYLVTSVIRQPVTSLARALYLDFRLLPHSQKTHIMRQRVGVRTSYSVALECPGDLEPTYGAAEDEQHFC